MVGMIQEKKSTKRRFNRWTTEPLYLSTPIIITLILAAILYVMITNTLDSTITNSKNIILLILLTIVIVLIISSFILRKPREKT